MNMFASIDENPARRFELLRKQNVTDGRTHGRTDGQRENSTPTIKKFAGGIIIINNIDRNFL